MSVTVLMVNSLYAPQQGGGAEKSVQLLAESLTALGNAVHVLTLIDREPAHTRSLNGVHVHECVIRNSYWPFGNPRHSAIKRLQWHLADINNDGYDAVIEEMLEHIDPDVVHTHNLVGFSTRIWALAKQRGIPVVHTLRDYYLSCPSSTRYRKDQNCDVTCLRCKPFEMARKPGSCQIDAVVGISQFILDDHLKRGFFQNVRTSAVILNTVERKDLQRETRSVGPIRIIGYLGMLTPNKGIDRLLAAFTEVAPEDATLLVGGTGDDLYVQQLKDRFQHPGIRFLGFVDPLKIYASADAIVVPSLWNEPFSRVAMETAVYGIPLIAANRGGLPEVVKHSGAILFDPDVPSGLAEALRAMLARRSGPMDQQLLAHPGATEFDPPRGAAAYLRIYKNASNGRPRRALRGNDEQ